jgi:hypothetical protein
METTTVQTLEGETLVPRRRRNVATAWAAARSWARRLGEDVRLLDAHGTWRISPAGGGLLEEAAPFGE